MARYRGRRIKRVGEQPKRPKKPKLPEYVAPGIKRIHIRVKKEPKTFMDRYGVWLSKQDPETLPYRVFENATADFRDRRLAEDGRAAEERTKRWNEINKDRRHRRLELEAYRECECDEFDIEEEES